MLQTGFFDFEDRFKKIDEKDKLLELNVLIDWEAFRPVLKKLEPKRKNSAGRKRKDSVMMGLLHFQELHRNEHSQQIPQKPQNWIQVSKTMNKQQSPKWFDR